MKTIIPMTILGIMGWFVALQLFLLNRNLHDCREYQVEDGVYAFYHEDGKLQKIPMGAVQTLDFSPTPTATPKTKI